MRTAQRVSRGFHRLAVFFAAIPLVIGAAYSTPIVIEAMTAARKASLEHNRVMCAHQYLNQIRRRRLSPEAKIPASSQDVLLASDDIQINLRSIGCSNSDATISLGEARNPPKFSLLGAFASAIAALTLTLALSLAIYGLFRAIGWVIGGFAAS